MSKEACEALLQRARQGDEAAFETLYLSHAGRLYSIAYRFCGNDADAQDVVQEAMLKAWRGMRRFRGDSSFATWLYRIAVNCAKDHLQHQRKGGEVSMEVLQQSGFDPAQTGFEEHSNARADIRAALSALSAEHRQMLILRELEGFSYEEIARILRLPVGTVRSRINRARLALKNKYLSAEGTKTAIRMSKNRKGLRE